MFFFFQAEDGIRDTSVTGVQTCALPIFGETALHVLIAHGQRRQPPRLVARRSLTDADCAGDDPEVERGHLAERWLDEYVRSEERRVGKECRCGGWRSQ